MSILPAEEPLTDLERSFFESEPPGLFPQNQDSYWGQLRKVVSDKLQEVADLLAVFYLNQSANTVNQDDMTEWEQMLGIPANSGRTLEQRRSFVLSRLIYGAFTRTRRAAIVESFITATFGPTVSLTPEGVSLPADGVSLYSEVVNLAGTYAIRENWPDKNLVSDSSFEVDDLSGTPWTFTSVGGATAILDAVSAWHGARGVHTNIPINPGAAQFVSGFIPVDRTLPYALSAYFMRLSAVAANGFFRLLAYDAAHAAIGSPAYIGPVVADPGAVLTGAGGVFQVAQKWTRYGGVYPANSLPVGTAYVKVQIFTAYQPATAQEVFLDAVQFEQSDKITDFNDTSGPDFYYEVRVLDSLDIDAAGLQRELSRYTPAHITFDITLTPAP